MICMSDSGDLAFGATRRRLGAYALAALLLALAALPALLGW
jgi:hypothetical protein